jgi:hypothetical protein
MEKNEKLVRGVLKIIIVSLSAVLIYTTAMVVLNLCRL